jgi:hypothetical protein
LPVGTTFTIYGCAALTLSGHTYYSTFSGLTIYGNGQTSALYASSDFFQGLSQLNACGIQQTGTIKLTLNANNDATGWNYVAWPNSVQDTSYGVLMESSPTTQLYSYQPRKLAFLLTTGGGFTVKMPQGVTVYQGDIFEISFAAMSGLFPTTSTVSQTATVADYNNNAIASVTTPSGAPPFTPPIATPVSIRLVATGMAEGGVPSVAWDILSVTGAWTIAS